MSDQSNQPWNQASGQPPWSPPAAEQQPSPGGPAKKSRTPLIIGAVIGTMVLVGGLAGFLIINNANREREAEEQASQQAAADRVAGAAAAVQGLFDALIAGDAATALTFVTVDGNGDLLTDEVLAVSAELGPITDVVVTPPAEVPEYFPWADVEVSYMVADEPVSIAYRSIDEDGDGTFVVENALISGYLYDSYGDLEILLNGAAVPGEDFLLFPGAYEFTVATEYFALAEDAAFVATEQYAADIPVPEPVLNEDGLTVFRDAVTAAVETCVASTTLEAGCGLAMEAELSDGTVLEDRTLVRTLTDDAAAALEELEATLASDNPAVAEGSYIGGVEVVAEGTQDGEAVKGDIIFPPSLGVPAVNMTDPELAVTWS